MSSSKTQLEIISISDIHLGNTRVPANFIIANLNRMLPTDGSLSSVDIIILAGDIFDQALNLPDAEVIMDIQIWIARLLNMCVVNDIQLRILEGTPSHDRGQSYLFDAVNCLIPTPADMVYYPDLTIEHNEKFNIDILYIPDEYHATTTETLMAVRNLLANKGLTKVDFAVMHGMFPFQLPQGLLGLPQHDEEAYLEIVKHLIFIGHVHHPVRRGKILVQGSTDRLKHGEEEDKGFWRVVVDLENPDNNKYTFVINEGAKIFRTVDISKVDDTRPILEELLKYPQGSNFRLKAFKDSTKPAEVRSFQEKFPQYRWETDIIKVDKSAGDISARPALFQPKPINVNTINDLVLNHMHQRGYPEAIIASAMVELESLK